MGVDLAIQISLVIGVAAVVATVAGFGNSLVAMPLLIGLVGVRAAAPMMALAGLATWLVRFWQLRSSTTWSVVWKVILASLTTIPLGVAFVSYGPEVWLRTLLGIMTVGYVVYRWLGRKPPPADGNRWANGVGAAGGILSGAFNTSGPVIVMYGDARRWSPEVFRANLAAYFAANLLMVNLTHLVSGNITPVVWQGFLAGLPGGFAGLLAGMVIAPRVDRERFSQMVLVLLFILGVRLALSWLL